MTRIVGVFIILAGFASFAFGLLPTIAVAMALASGKPIPDSGQLAY